MQTMNPLELPSINSTTSISDNPDLKNYYDNLLFKNNSGKSLTDLPRKYNNTNSDTAASNSHPNKKINIDFIKGFGNNHNNNNNSTNSPLSRETTQDNDEIDPKRRSSKVTFTSLQMTPTNSNQSDNNNDSLDLFQNSNLQNHDYNNSNMDNFTLHQGRRQSIFNTIINPTSSNSNDNSNDNNVNTTNNTPNFNTSFNFNDSTTPNNNNNIINNVNHSNINDPNNSNFIMNSPLTSAGNMSNTNNKQQIFSSERRSSYISDTLIHRNFEDHYKYNYNYNYNNTTKNNNNMSTLNEIFNYTPNMINNTDNFYHKGSIPELPIHAPMYPYQQQQQQQQQQQHHHQQQEPFEYNANFFQNQRRNTQPAIMNMNNNPYINNTAISNYNQRGNTNSNNNQYGYLNFVNGQYTNKNSNNNSNMNINSDNGLILLGNKQLTSSKELQKIYLDSGSNYFSSEKVYEFVDYIKNIIESSPNDNTNDKDKISSFDNKVKKSILTFLAFLKSCNLNYNPQSDAFISKDKYTNNNNNKNNFKSNRKANNSNEINFNNNNNNSTSSYLHYKPLVLVSLKNGKLELLSTSQNSNLLMKRGDLIVIDGDRGKDLALVIEPKIDLNLALMINFLKKKIHFDSLITSKKQHYPNDKFIKALIDSTRGLSDELNPKLYDVIELIQLVVPSKQILRFATPWEVSTNLHNKFQDELKALHIAQLKLKSLNSGLNSNNHENEMNNDASTPPFNDNNDTKANDSKNTNINSNNKSSQLNIKILNAEFQFDRKKLTFYYICEERNDFRELIKELFKFYKTRIWLCAIPNNLNIDTKYYDNQQYELKMYQDMMSHYISEDLNDLNFQQNNSGGFIVAPALDKLKLDDFQIGVYKELVFALFG